MSANEGRRTIGKSRTLGSYATVYEVHDGLEFELNEQYDVVQKRVLFDDVLMVTIHRELGPLYLFIMGMLALFFLGLATAIVSVGGVEVWPVAAIFGVGGLPLLIAFLVRLFLGVDVITVFGRRSKASVRFTIRKTRARQVYGAICAAVLNAHRGHENESAAPPAAT